MNVGDARVGNRDLRARCSDKTEMQPGMCFHFMAGIWMKSYGVAISESFVKPVFSGAQTIQRGAFITAGNASQLSDGASASVLMEARLCEQREVEPLGAYGGIAVAGCGPDEMGIGPVFAVPKLLKANGLSMDDIDLWELNEPLPRRLSIAATDWASIQTG